MAQHDYVIANASGANVRADINNMALAISSNNSGSSAPSTTYAYLWWLDTGNNLLKLRNSANNAWITMPFSVTANNTVDINGGAIDGTPIGASSASTGAFSTLSTSSGLTVVGTSQITNTSSIDTLTLVGNTGSVAGVKLQAEEVHGAMYGINIGSNYGGLAFHTNNNGTVAEKVRIDNAGKFGIGTASPGDYNFGDLTVTNGTSAGITLASATNSIGTLAFADGTSGSTAYMGFLQYSHITNALVFGANGSTKMTLDSTGKLGVGTTSPGAKLDVNGEVFVSPNTAGKNTFQLTTNASNDGRLKMLSDTTTKVDIQVNGNTYFNGGNVAIGTASPESLLHVYKGDSGSTYSADGADQIILENSDSVGMDIRTPSSNTGLILFSDNDARGRGQLAYYHSDDAMVFITAGSERARITSEGRLCLGFTAKQDDAFLSVISNGSEGIFNGVNSTNAYRRYYHTVSDGIHRFKGSANTPTITNGGAWQDASDVAYKEDIQDISYGLDAVKTLRPRTYKMKGTDLGDGKGLDQKIGFIAQEAELVVPEVVDGEDGEKTMSYGQLTAVLTKAIQEQQEQIEQLKTEIQTLKGE